MIQFMPANHSITNVLSPYYYNNIILRRYFKWNNFVTRKEETNILLFVFNLNILEHCSVRLHSSCGKYLRRLLTDRPKSVRNRCIIELFCGVVCVVTLPFWYFCWCRGFVIGLSQISSFSLTLAASVIWCINIFCVATEWILTLFARETEEIWHDHMPNTPKWQTMCWLKKLG